VTGSKRCPFDFCRSAVAKITNKKGGFAVIQTNVLFVISEHVAGQINHYQAILEDYKTIRNLTSTVIYM
jgi:hypothetical protein